MATTPTAAEAVARGAAMLDEQHPGWHRYINISRLDISSCQNCVCGQLGNSLMGLSGDRAYTFFLNSLDLPDWEGFFGFEGIYDFEAEIEYENAGNTLDPDDERFWVIAYEMLDAEWAKEIRDRLAEDDLEDEEVTSTASKILVHV